MKKRTSLGLTLAPLPALPTLLRSTDVKRLLPDKVRPSSDAYLTFKKKCFYCIKKTMYVVIVIVSVSVSVCVCVCVCVSGEIHRREEATACQGAPEERCVPDIK